MFQLVAYIIQDIVIKFWVIFVIAKKLKQEAMKFKRKCSIQKEHKKPKKLTLKFCLATLIYFVKRYWS